MDKQDLSIDQTKLNRDTQLDQALSISVILILEYYKSNSFVTS